MKDCDAKKKNEASQKQHPVLTQEQKEALKEAYEERRAILEYEAGYSRSEADRRAWLMVYGKGKNQQ